MNQLSLSARPKSLDGLVGQQKMVERIRGHMASGRALKAWLLTGPKGTGKTTTARILALSYLCIHQKVWGAPCTECRKNKASFDIYEINAAKITGKQEIEEILEGAEYGPRFGAYRIYILDEAHMMSVAAQNLALKYLEDSPDTTIFILNSTAPHKIIETLQSRCMVYKLQELRMDDMLALVESLLNKVQSDLPGDRLVDALEERGVRSPRLIAQAVEKYVTGASPEEAAEVEGSDPIDLKSVTRGIVSGDWVSVGTFLKKAQPSDSRAIRLGVLAYLRAILLNEKEISERTSAVSKAITAIVSVQNAEDIVLSAAVVSALYTICAFFAKYKR